MSDYPIPRVFTAFAVVLSFKVSLHQRFDKVAANGSVSA